MGMGMNSQTIHPKEVVLRRLNMTLNQPFTTSFGTETGKDFCLVEVIDENGNSGWGESVAMTGPFYNEETTETNQLMLENYLIPAILGKTFHHPDEANELFAPIRRNRMAKSTLETAIWDLYAKNNQISLKQALGGDEQKQIEVGVSIGIHDSVEELLKVIEGKISNGLRKIKLKIKPGKDVEVIREVRKVYPDIPLMADANSAYTLEDIGVLKQLEEFNLMMIEQPLQSDDILEHSLLQKQLKTPICLDESICSFKDAKEAIELGSCKIINIKIGRVGGLSEAKKIHDLCKEHGIPVWCGGMLEAGVGRAHNIALTSLSQFTIPGDTGPSRHYWKEDIISPEVTVENGIVLAVSGPGIGYAINRDVLDRYTVDKKVFSA
ncbi:o-succinylbenzoate synthase [Falsibacillus pallidus]|uniref:o-succinylbenzoate synthase n=1 Tax=Falsibacillus pallidus TaxID=493781 RepID=A0A370GBU6_9BACI|nr:O-succinylbenzoate synthase [Falsibacillus pallidus]